MELISAAAQKRGRRSFYEELVLQLIAVGGLFFTFKVAMKYLDPYREQREQVSEMGPALPSLVDC